MNDDRKGIEQHGRDTCYFCESDGPIETHHIVPRRFDGDDHPDNLVDLCPTCHRRLENLYDRRFYADVGAEEIDHQLQIIINEVADQLDELSDTLQGQSLHLRSQYLDPDVEDVVQDAVDRYYEDQDEPEEHDSKETIKVVRETVEELESGYEKGAPIDDIFDRCDSRGVPEETTDAYLNKLRQRGEVYEPYANHLRTT